MEIISNKETANCSKEELFVFLSDMSNYKQLMPDQVTDWSADSNECKYVLNGMAQIGMMISEKKPNEKIVINSHGKVPFTFKLDVDITGSDAGTSAVQLVFNGDVNMFMKPMLEKPLTNFFNFIVKKINQKFTSIN